MAKHLGHGHLDKGSTYWAIFADNEGKSATRVCHQVAAWVPDVFHNFYLVKNHKIAYNPTTTDAREKVSTDLESLEF